MSVGSIVWGIPGLQAPSLAYRKGLTVKIKACADCGSFRVMVLAWVDVNTGQYYGHYSEEDPYCLDCNNQCSYLLEGSL